MSDIPGQPETLYDSWSARKANWLASVWCCSFDGSRACADAESTDSPAKSAVHIVAGDAAKAGKSTTQAWRTRPRLIYVGAGVYQGINWKAVEATTTRCRWLGEQVRARRGITRSPCAHDVGPDRKSVVDESQVDGFRASVRGTNGRGFGLLAFIGNLCLLVSVFSRYIVTTTVRVSRRDRTLSITSRAHRTRVQLGVSLTLTLRLSSISSCHLPFLLLASLLLSAPLPSPCCFSLSMTRLSALFSAHVQSFSALPRHPFLSPRPRSREREIRRENSGA